MEHQKVNLGQEEIELFFSMLNSNNQGKIDKIEMMTVLVSLGLSMD
jgi:Ca2+-binding EF-hand superfamily protein